MGQQSTEQTETPQEAPATTTTTTTETPAPAQETPNEGGNSEG